VKLPIYSGLLLIDMNTINRDTERDNFY